MEYLEEMGRKAVRAKYELQGLTTEVKNKALQAAAAALTAFEERILEANTTRSRRQTACQRDYWIV